jgi:hypothetical protein
MMDQFDQNVMRCRLCARAHRTWEPLEHRVDSLRYDMERTDARVVDAHHLRGFLRRFAGIERDWVRHAQGLSRRVRPISEIACPEH